MADYFPVILKEENAQFGFNLFVVVLTLLWNLDWKHYVRYWKRSKPYTRRSILILRCFFAACCIVGIWNFVEYAIDFDWIAVNFGSSLLIALAMLLPFALFDVSVRWRLGRPNVEDFEI